MATSSKTFSTHGSIPPRSARRAVGGTYTLAIPPGATRLRLVPSSPRVARGLRLLLGEGMGSASSEFTGTVVTGGSSSCAGGGVGGALVKCGTCAVFKFIFFRCQYSVMDLLREFDPWLTPVSSSVSLRRCDDGKYPIHCVDQTVDEHDVVRLE